MMDSGFRPDGSDEIRSLVSPAITGIIVPHNTIHNWVGAFKAGKLGEVGKGQRPLTEVEMEMARLRQELAQARMECDILKPPRTLQRSRRKVRDD